MMKKNYLKLATLLLGVAILVSSCLKTEELDSVKKLREAKVDNVKASTALMNADVQIKLASAAAQKIKNSYDSANYVYTLQINAANAKYQAAVYANSTSRDAEQLKRDIANLESQIKTIGNSDTLATSQLKVNLANLNYQLQQQVNSLANLAEQHKVDLANLAYNLAAANAQIANQVEYAKRDLSNARQSVLNAQYNELQDSLNLGELRLSNPAKANAMQDYFVYYNGGTLNDNTNIPNGIYTLKSQILGWRDDILTQTANKQSKTESNANDILNFRSTIRTDSLAIVADQRLLAIGVDAKNSQDYAAAYASLVALTNTAYTDLNIKKAAATDALNKRDTASLSSTKANTDFSDNNTTKNNYETAYKAIITLVVGGGKLYSDMQVKMNEVAADLTEKQNVYNSWKSKYDAAYNALNNAKTDYANKLAAKNSADEAVNAAQVNGGTASPSLLTAQTNANTALGTASTTLTNKQNDYDNIQPTYAADETNYNNAKEANDSILARNDRYTTYKAKFDLAVSKEAGLLAIKNAEDAILANLNSNLSAAQTAQANAQSYYNTVNTAKTNMKGVMDGIYTANTTIDNLIATTNKNIAVNQNDIADIKLQIARVGSTDYKIDENIKIDNQKISVAQSLVDLYEQKAATLKALIATL